MYSEDLKSFAKVEPEWVKTTPKVTGYLRKQKQKTIGTAKKRYFYLRNKFLFYYRNPLDLEPINGVCLEEVHIETVLKGRVCILQLSCSVITKSDLIFAQKEKLL
jgi:hypothetical protein